MLEEMVKSIIKKQIETDFPHLLLPAVTRAKVTRVTASDNWFEYNLKIIDKLGDFDERFPEIPGVMSKVQVEAGKVVAIGFLYGELNPCIIGEVF
ncbi:hypothetical protein LY28_02769 [Ruminiclostridium sufflavum DSM 19573]|uniref:Uncharacterized protein n=1 Tax=Ruminiclostridium sufflavum DSM 19573 TaxID=1121337 RepID=A0A318XK60_9FIRM|nr:hypothetical protein [Ruminiclostridium sufflavum]PYG86743.1 hypothetical protein LY28_02769 [Ruminiclostridium sufflavum DSM 19573]